MSENNPMVTISDKLSTISDRERVLLVFTAIVVIGVVFWFVFRSVSTSLEVKENSIKH